MINIKKNLSTLLNQLIKLGTIIIFTSLIILFTKAFLEIFISIFLEISLDDSVLFDIVKIDYRLLVKLSFFTGSFLFMSSLTLAVPLVFMRELHIISQYHLENVLYFMWKCAATAYPTLVLAAALNESSFSLITNFISFFVIFSFIFKSNFFSKKK